MFNLFKSQKKVKAKSFFDYKSKEKKKILKEAAQNSNKMQYELVKKYKRAYST